MTFLFTIVKCSDLCLDIPLCLFCSCTIICFKLMYRNRYNVVLCFCIVGLVLAISPLIFFSLSLSVRSEFRWYSRYIEWSIAWNPFRLPMKWIAWTALYENRTNKSFGNIYNRIAFEISFCPEKRGPPHQQHHHQHQWRKRNCKCPDPRHLHGKSDREQQERATWTPLMFYKIV